MAQLATGVTIITARQAGGEFVGLTANSFNSISLDPPLVVLCVDKHSQTPLALQAEGATFAVNILSREQGDYSG